MAHNYVGKGKVVGKFGNIKIGMKAADLKPFITLSGYLNLIVSQMKEPDKYGNTHTVYVDDYRPTNARATHDDDEPGF